ncbi:MAG: AAA family ATPase [Hyphomicrobiaceae bacterium]|nr:AAA family ATPase [Hyphomicrobiaceae bacterium]
MTFQYFYGILVGLIIALALPDGQLQAIRDGIRRAFQGVRRIVRAPFEALWKTDPQAAATASAAVAAAEPAPEPQPTGPDRPVGPRLIALQGEFERAIEDLPHSRDFFHNERFNEAVGVLADPLVPLDTVVAYAIGTSWSLSCVGLAALKQRPDREEAREQILSQFDRLVPFAIHFGLEYLQSLDPRPALGVPLLTARDWWPNNSLIAILFKEYFARAAELGDEVTFGPGLADVPAAKHDDILAILGRIQHPASQVLRTRLAEHQRSSVDEAFLTTFGRFWRNKRELEAAIEPESWKEALTEAEATAREEPVRSLLVSGEHRVGKTTFYHLLARRLSADGWLVFEASGADLMAGQKWFGELEGRIQRAVNELTVQKKLIWYIPDLLQIALSGTHQGQAASILDQIMPAVSAGRLIIWTESSASGMAKLLRLNSSLRSVFEVVRMDPMEPEEATALAHALAAKLAGELTIDTAAIDVALSSARQYLSTSSMPGAVLDLIKLTIGRMAKSTTRHISPHDVIVTLAQQTGLPASILDNQERLDIGAMRAHFSARVIGQEEAVGAVVERITMLKAGLNDLTKPIGVLMFAGSTGTGKTELAKTLADFLFGSTDRMIRLDMSEFQTPESTAKILGVGDRHGDVDSLITRVRKQPFSVVLLDEFEKAHPNVWDLFLQVFDDGRLSDATGQEADFRHCIIILTTNLGATSHRTSGLGFARGADMFTSDQIMRAVNQTFRPEFQNRIDKIIVFQPLTRELMRSILKKELAGLLQRRGFKDREWAVEWEASALEFLLEKGFTPEMGARPLKRAIDQYVIAPLAATIVERRFPEGDQFVFIRSDGRAIQAEFVDPDADLDDPRTPLPSADRSAANGGSLPTLADIILSAAGTAQEQHVVAAAMDEVEAALASPGWEDLNARCLERMQAPDFWQRPDRHASLAQLALMDRVKAAAQTARSLQARREKGRERAGRSSRELIARTALQLHLVKEGIADVFAEAPVEVAIAVEPALARPAAGEAEGTQWAGEVLAMYRGWAARRNMQVTEVANAGERKLPWLLVSGFGAHRILTPETGLHVFEGDDGEGTERFAARVKVIPAPLGDLSQDRLKGQLSAGFAALAVPGSVVRRYRESPAPLVRQIAGTPWRSGKLEAVMAGDFDLIGLVQTSGE